jgi:hypothetical protein
MKSIKLFFQNFNVLNSVLAVAAIILLLALDIPLINKNMEVTISGSNSALEQNRSKIAENNTAYLDYAAITDKNLFNPERRMPAENRDNLSVARPEIILYGTLITSETKIAYIEDKKSSFSTAGRGKRPIALSMGRSIAGYVLKEVHPESILLVRGTDKMVITLRNPKDRGSADSSANQQSLNRRADQMKSTGSSPTPPPSTKNIH